LGGVSNWILDRRSCNEDLEEYTSSSDGEKEDIKDTEEEKDTDAYNTETGLTFAQMNPNLTRSRTWAVPDLSETKIIKKCSPRLPS